MRKATWAMSTTELAKVVARHYGYRGGHGGWIYTPTNKPVCQGWQNFGTLLESKGFISKGRGVNWTLIDWAGGPTRGINPCPVCRTVHVNACPVLWG